MPCLFHYNLNIHCPCLIMNIVVFLRKGSEMRNFKWDCSWRNPIITCTLFSIFHGDNGYASTRCIFFLNLNSSNQMQESVKYDCKNWPKLPNWVTFFSFFNDFVCRMFLYQTCSDKGWRWRSVPWCRFAPLTAHL